MLALETHRLSRTYGDAFALADVELRIRAGEIHGLLGLNGAGKTTLLRLLLALAAPTQGSVRLLGRDAGTAAGPARGGVAGLVDAPHFYGYLSGRQNLRLLARLDGLSREADVDSALADVGLTAAADAHVATYSAGMKQRLGLASALLRAPTLLLLDEPTSALDPAAAKDLRERLRALAAAGAAILFSSHDLHEVEALCSDVTILHRGRAVFSGPVSELRERTAIHALSTSDDDAARALAAEDAAVVVAANDDAGLDLEADEAALDRFVIALGRAGVAVRALTRREPSLEALFLRLTAQAPALSEATPSAEPAEPAAPVRHRGGIRAVVSIETSKLAARTFVRATLGVCVVAPFGFVAALKVQSSLPEDTLLGRFAKTSGFAVPLVVLGFAGMWLLPLLASLVAGDIFASEDRAGTWSTLLLRSRTRTELFVGKTLAAFGFTFVSVLTLAAASIAAGVLLVGIQPLVGLSGTLLPPRDAIGLVVLAWASVLPPAFAFTGFALFASITTRSSAAGIGFPVLAGLLMQLVALVNVPETLRRALVTTPFGAWHGLFAAPSFHGPLLQGIVLSASYLAAALAAAYVQFERRELGP